MRLERARISNFKLLEDVELEFSTDPDRPLTVIRAENGSGKTSILYALRWALWGEHGIPEMRLSSTATPAGKTVPIQVTVEFVASEPYSGDPIRYRLISTSQETTTAGDDYTRTPQRQRLVRCTDRGDEDVAEVEGFIATELPMNLADVFFTNGDDVQRFVSGNGVPRGERQGAVHRAIRQLLGLDHVENASDVLEFVAKKIRRDMANSGSNEHKSAQDQLDRIDEETNEKKERLEQIKHRKNRIYDDIHLDERDLDALKGVGDLETIQARIRSIESDIQHLGSEETGIRRRIKDLLRSEGLSWGWIGDKLRAGLNNLDELEQRDVIPGASIEVLIDRVEMGTCICGEPLEEGQPRHAHVVSLINEQRKVAPHLQRLTKLWHDARSSAASNLAAGNDGTAVPQQVTTLREELTRCRDRQRLKQAELVSERQKREHIPEARIRELTERLASNRGKLLDAERDYGHVSGDIQRLQQQADDYAKIVDEQNRNQAQNEALQHSSAVAQDLATLAKGTLDRLKSSYVEKVSSRMNTLFLDIVGADPDAAGALFSSVNINQENDIIVHSLESRTLDTDTEVNGASQRALTLAFIWALMEVAEREAPRIIDTPLGMTSGSVKLRMVELLTEPTPNGLPFQVVLFMTRSEIRDIEPLIERRAGVVTTLACSKDYPVDLSNDWGIDYPVVKTCKCNYQQVCFVCARRNDSGRFEYREVLR